LQKARHRNQREATKKLLNIERTKLAVLHRATIIIATNTLIANGEHLLSTKATTQRTNTAGEGTWSRRRKGIYWIYLLLRLGPCYRTVRLWLYSLGLPWSLPLSHFNRLTLTVGHLRPTISQDLHFDRLLLRPLPACRSRERRQNSRFTGHSPPTPFEGSIRFY